MFKKCLNLSFFERSFPAKNRKPYPNFFQHLVLPIKNDAFMKQLEKAKKEFESLVKKGKVKKSERMTK